MNLQKPINDHINVHKLRLRDRLKNSYNRLPFHELGSKVAEIEDWTVKHLQETLWNVSPMLFGCVPCKRPFHVVDTNKGNVYEICVNRDLENTRNLKITLLEKCYPKRSNKLFTSSFEPFGPFSTMTISLPFPLLDYAEPVLSIAKAVLDSSQDFLTKTIFNVSASHENRLSKQIYSKIGNIVNDKTLLNNLWITCLTNRYSFRIANPRVLQATASIYQQHSDIHSYSANRMLAELISSWQPRGELLVDASYSQKKSIEADIRLAGYTKEGDILSDVLIGLYGGYIFTIVPLFIDSSFAVFAHLPTEHRATIEPVLKSQKNTLSSLIRPLKEAIMQEESAFIPQQHSHALSNIKRIPQSPSFITSELPQHIHFLEARHSVIVDRIEVPLYPTHFILLRLLATNFSNDMAPAKQLIVMQSFYRELKIAQKIRPLLFNQKGLALIKTLANAVDSYDTSPLSKLLNDIRRSLAKSALHNLGASKLSASLPKGPGCNIRLSQSSITFDH
jgi:hypothetical protein